MIFEIFCSSPQKIVAVQRTSRIENKDQSMKLKVAIVGCGKIADAHVEQIRATNMAEVVAVCDQEILMAKQLGDRFGITNLYDDLDTMQRETKPDVVHLATPPSSHPYLAERAMENGANVFVEKPFALNAADAIRICDASNRTGRKISVNYLFCYESPYLALLDAYKTGTLGDVVHMDLTYGYDLAGDYGLAVLSDESHWVHSLPGKLFHNVLDHIVCKTTRFLPSSELEVKAIALRRRAATGNPVIDSLPDELRFLVRSDNVTANGYISAHAKPAAHFMRVLGTKDSFDLDFGGRSFVPFARQRYPSALGRLLPARDMAKSYSNQSAKNNKAFWNYEFNFFQGMRVLLTQFYGAIANGDPLPFEHDDIIKAAKVIDQLVIAVNQYQSETRISK
jgi:predicted dehydrogenase